MSSPWWHPLSLLGFLCAAMLCLWRWFRRRCCCCCLPPSDQTSASQKEEDGEGRSRRARLCLEGLDGAKRPLLEKNLEAPPLMLLDTPPEDDDEENVSPEDALKAQQQLDPSDAEGPNARGAETRSLDRHFFTWQQRGGAATVAPGQREAAGAGGPAAALGHFETPGVALLDESAPQHNSAASAPQRFANFLSRRLKRTKSFPKLIRNRTDQQQKLQDYDQQLAAAAEADAAMRASLGESALRTDEAEQSQHHVRSMMVGGAAPLSVHLGHRHQQNALRPLPHSQSALSLRPSRSHESLLLLTAAAGAASPAAGGWREIQKSPSDSQQQQQAELLLRRLQPVHPSLSPDNCFRVDDNVFACRNSEERSRWMDSFRRRMNPELERMHRVENSISVWVLEAKGVHAKRRFFCELSLDGQLKGRTSTKGMADGICFWGESFEFGSLPPTRLLCIDLFRESDPAKKSISRRGRSSGQDREDRHTLIGLVNIPLSELAGRQPVEKWYSVSSGDPNNNSANGTSSALSAAGADSSHPSIRVKARYQSVHILPLRAYKPLREFLRLHFLPLCAVFEPILGVKAKEDFATALVRILHREKRAAEALADLAMVEVEGQENDHLLFRGNSLATKAVEAYMKLVASDYLQRVLGDFVRGLLSSNLNCEVDALRLSAPSAASLDRNRRELTKKVEEAWSRIRHSTEHFPHPLRILFSTVRRQLELGGRAELADNLLSSSIFLRFLCPAILSPSLFGLVPEYPTGTAARNLTLIAKSLQTLANFTRFGGKESYMEFMNGFVEREWRNMQCFLRKISAPSPASVSDENRLRAINADIDLGKELSLLHCYLSEAWSSTPKLSNNSLAAAGLVGELREVLVAVNRAATTDENEGTTEDEYAATERSSVATQHNPPSDYENNSQSQMLCYNNPHNGTANGGSCASSGERKSLPNGPRRAVLPPKPVAINGNSQLPYYANSQYGPMPAAHFSPANTASNHLDSTDDYVLSSALAQLNLQQQQVMHLYDETPRVQPPQEPHLYDEVAMDGQHPRHHLTPPARMVHPDERMLKQQRLAETAVVAAPQRGVAESCVADRHELYTSRVIRRGSSGGGGRRGDDADEIELGAEDESDSTGEELCHNNSCSSATFRHHLLQQQRRAHRKKSLGASSAGSSSAAAATTVTTITHHHNNQLHSGSDHFNGSQDSSAPMKLNSASGIALPSSGYQSQMNSSSYSSNSSSPIDTNTDSSQHHLARPAIAIANPLYSSGNSSTSTSSSSSSGAGVPTNVISPQDMEQRAQATNGQTQQLQAKPRTNPSCWSIPCTSAVVQQQPSTPSAASFVRCYPPLKFPLITTGGDDPLINHHHHQWSTPPASAGPLQNGNHYGNNHHHNLFTSASVDMLERGQAAPAAAQQRHRRGISEQDELLEARRKIEELQRENAVMRQELDRLKGQTVVVEVNGHIQQATEADTI